MTESKKKLAVSRHGRKTDACNSSGVSDLPNFIGPTLTITISEGQRISMTSHKALEACVSSPVSGIRRQDPQSHRMEAGFWGWRCSNTAARSSASVGSIRACPLAPMKWACAETHRLQAAGTTTNSDTSSRRCSPPREATHPGQPRPVRANSITPHGVGALRTPTSAKAIIAENHEARHMAGLRFDAWVPHGQEVHSGASLLCTFPSASAAFRPRPCQGRPSQRSSTHRLLPPLDDVFRHGGIGDVPGDGLAMVQALRAFELHLVLMTGGMGSSSMYTSP